MQPFKITYTDFGIKGNYMTMASSIEDGKKQFKAMLKSKGINIIFCSDFDIRFGW